MTQVGSNVESLTDRAERLQTLLGRFEVGDAAVAASRARTRLWATVADANSRRTPCEHPAGRRTRPPTAASPPVPANCRSSGPPSNERWLPACLRDS
ncbi:hypothetical protein [Haloarcula sp. JP-L23]|uniref:hypothetical protein n=1 Tax=Haloarcula sp. JP-L23 TaxID=2716717 RepID=UPI001D04889A